VKKGSSRRFGCVDSYRFNSKWLRFLWVAVSFFAKCLIAQFGMVLIQGSIKNLIKINNLQSEYEINTTNLGENAGK
jgi:hypothetical protein